MKNKLQNLAMIVSIAISVFAFSQNLFAQTQRNPVLEFCTGTWCQWCPCGDQAIEQNILPNIPNAIILAYHGAGTDPFRNFPGNTIINSLFYDPGIPGVGYPTGAVDRVSGILGSGSWYGIMNNRKNVPATVGMDITRSYNAATREFSANIEFTALQNLNGQYSYLIILVEDGPVWGQTSNNTCTPGITYIPNYIHYWLVREIMNGESGEVIVNGAWNQGAVINKSFIHTITVPPAPAPDIVPDSCGIVVFVYKNGSPLNSVAEIQQAEQWSLIAPDYVVALMSSSSDLIVENNNAGNFTAVIENQGLLDDSYYVDVNMAAPLGWTGEFTTPNGTFPMGQQDLVAVSAGDTLAVDISVLPNVINGTAEITILFTSMNDPNINTSATFSLVTTAGVPGLVIDASGESYADALIRGMDAAFDYTYGVVSKEALYSSIDLTNFTLICWSSGNALPVFTDYEVNALVPFLDNGGRLLINGQDIGQDIFDPSGQSHFAQSFYNSYLHANFVSNAGPTNFLRGIQGDIISNEINFGLNDIYPKSPDEFIPNDAFATSLFNFSVYSQYNSLRADDGTNRIIYLGFGLEQIQDQATMDTVVVRSINWLMNGIVLSTPNENLIAESYKLDQNYPNPFNPATTISYSIPKESNVSLIVYDIMGKQVAELVNSKQAVGSYNVQFDAAKLASGTYFYKLTAGEFISVKKMVLLK
jgi:hypothetical protein